MDTKVSKQIKVISWTDIESLIIERCNNRNPRLFEVLKEVSNIYREKNLNYVYYLDINYGERIIDHGEMFHLNNYSIEQNRYNKNIDDFINDLGYSDDPLGFVLSNHIEVFTENKSFGKKNNDWYSIPLNKLNTGDFFGVFGALDKMTNQIIDTKASRDWFAIAGSISFEIAFPFHNREIGGWIGGLSKLSSRDKKENDPSHADVKIDFIKRLFPELITEVIYIPQHFFDFDDDKVKEIKVEIPETIKLKLKTELLEIGWKQSFNLREGFFQDTAIYDFIRKMSVEGDFCKNNLNHDIKFLSLLINYLINASEGKALVLKPQKETDDIYLNSLIEKLSTETDLKGYFEYNDSFIPLIFKYDFLNNADEWGLASFFHLPIIHEYRIKNPSDLMRDICNIYSDISRNGDNTLKEKVKGLSKISGFYSSNDNGVEDSDPICIKDFDPHKGTRVNIMNNNTFIKEKMAKFYNLDIRRINLNSRIFSNLFYITYNED